MINVAIGGRSEGQLYRRKHSGNWGTLRGGGRLKLPSQVTAAVIMAAVGDESDGETKDCTGLWDL